MTPLQNIQNGFYNINYYRTTSKKLNICTGYNKLVGQAVSHRFLG